MPVLIAVLLVLALAAPASAAVPPAVHLVRCDTAARTADFEGDMRTVPGTSRMQMRFTVQVRGGTGGDLGWQRVQAPRLDVWVSSLPGRLRYLYSKHVEGLQPGVAYRVVVRFRWRAADGTVLRHALRRSRACKVPDPRPDLVPVRVSTAAGSDPGMRRYTVTVANHGHTAAPASSVALAVAETALPDQQVPELPAGARFQVAFEGPACGVGSSLVTTVDATGVVDEAVEADDLLTVPCTGA